MLARVKADKIAEKKRLAPYYFGGFSHGANTSATEGVHSEEMKPYLNGGLQPQTNQTNGIAHSATNGATNEDVAKNATNGEATERVEAEKSTVPEIIKEAVPDSVKDLVSEPSTG